jgi:hypothetical protein
MRKKCCGILGLGRRKKGDGNYCQWWSRVSRWIKWNNIMRRRDLSLRDGVRGHPCRHTHTRGGACPLTPIHLSRRRTLGRVTGGPTPAELIGEAFGRLREAEAACWRRATAGRSGEGKGRGGHLCPRDGWGRSPCPLHGPSLRSRRMVLAIGPSFLR